MTTYSLSWIQMAKTECLGLPGNNYLVPEWGHVNGKTVFYDFILLNDFETNGSFLRHPKTDLNYEMI